MINYVISDIDGTLTDGRISYDIFGSDIKYFNVKDGNSIKLLIENNITFILISGRKSRQNSIRAKELGVHFLFQKVKNKRDFLNYFLKKNNILPENCAYIGDDINDYESMLLFPYRFCPKDAHYNIQKISTFKSKLKGGEGALVSISKHILEINNLKI